ncbi:SDR family NAD(P)-dependent oxidoreductase [Micromonospora sp. M12]
MATGATIVVLERDADAVNWLADHPAADRLVAVVGDAADERVAEHAAELADHAAPLSGWVNNAAVFRDAALHSASADTVLELIGLNLRPAVVGAAVAVRRFLAAPPAARSSTSRRTRPADRLLVPCRMRRRRPPWRG